MRCMAYLCVAGVLASGQVARAATGYVVTYESSRMMPMQGNAGIKGVWKIQASWSIAQLPPFGHCSAYSQTLTAYTDGENTLQSLEAAGYEFTKNSFPVLHLCITHHGAISQESSMEIPLINRLGGGHDEIYDGLKAFDAHGASVTITTYDHGTETSEFGDVAARGKLVLSGGGSWELITPSACQSSESPRPLGKACANAQINTSHGKF